MQGVHNRGIMADRTDDPRIGKVIAGYRIEERVGRGGMGVVYRAEHLNLRRRAAIKIIAPDLAESEGFRERFTREARIAAALQHPNIVTVYDAGEVDGILYLAMQYIEGNDLVRDAAQGRPAAALPRDRRLPPGRLRARRRARDGPHPPRRQARQRADRGPHGVPDRLRPDQAHGRHPHGADPRRRRRRHDPLRRARADRGRPGQRPQRRLLARLPALPLPHGPGAVLARHRRGGHLRAPLRAAAEAHGAAPGAGRGPRRRDRQGARQVARPPLPDLHGPRQRRPRRDRRRRAAGHLRPARARSRREQRHRRRGRPRGRRGDRGDARRGRGGPPPARAARRRRRQHPRGGADGARRPRRRDRGRQGRRRWSSAPARSGPTS